MIVAISTQTEAVSGESKFREDLKIYFPDLYKFWSLFQFDPFYEEVLKGMLEMVNSNGFGRLEILYNGGRISQVNMTKQLVANKSNKPEKILRRQNNDY